MKQKKMVGVLFILLFSVLYLHIFVAAECGDFICETGEEESCPSDCTTDGGEEIIDTCGDLVCDIGEETSCPQDCPVEEGEQTNVSGDNEDAVINNSADADVGEEDFNVDDSSGTIDNEASNSDLISPQTSERTFFSSKMKIIILIVVLILIIAGVVGGGIYFLKKKNSEEVPEQAVVATNVNSQ